MQDDAELIHARLTRHISLGRHRIMIDRPRGTWANPLYLECLAFSLSATVALC